MRTDFTGKCHICKQPISRSLWCDKCAAVNYVAGRIECVAGYDPQESLPWFDRVIAPTVNWTGLVDYINKNGGAEANKRLAELVAHARGAFLGSYSPHYPKDASESDRTQINAMHASGWHRAKTKARAHMEEAIKYGAHSPNYGKELAAAMRFLMTGEKPITGRQAA